MISATGLDKTYDERHAVKSVSFDIAKGEICGLVGLNGAGKSTILKMLSTWLIPTSGDAYVGGYSVVDNAARVRELIGYLPDKPPLYDDMPVNAYLVYVARLKAVPKPATAAEHALLKTGLLDYRYARIKELSHGYRQRLGIAAAIVNDPLVLILDEPINGLDPVQIVQMRDLILSFKSRMSILLSSHILSEITRTCDRIIMIHEGQIVAEGQERELSSARYRIQLRVAKDVELCIRDIRMAECVDHIASQNDGSLLLSCPEDARQDIAQIAVKYGLLELVLLRSDLEQLFMKLVQKGKEQNV